MNFRFLIFMLLHAAVPAICVSLYGAGPLWLLGSVLFSFAVYLTARWSSARATRLSLCLVSGAGMLLSLMLGVSYYMQGTGFNDQYFYHVDAQTAAIAVSAYGAVFIPALLGLGLAFFAPLMLYRRDAASRGNALPALVLWVAALVTSYPLHSLLSYRFGGSDQLAAVMPPLPEAADMEHSAPRPDVSGADTTAGQNIRKNIILIYAEGLEQLYFEQEIFGDIVPRLRALSKSAHRFTNTYQVPGTSWTIAGIVASQCGFPLLVGNHMASNSTLASTERPFEGEQCLADILEDQGYATVYMGGAPLAFAGKGNFLRTHGYQKVLGREQLTPLLPDQSYDIGWGLHDDSLFDLALQELERLESGDQPYLLTVLTLGTHHPSGYVAESCERLDGVTDSMSQAIYCSDQLISAFIENAMEMADMKDTVIVLFSDHLALRNTLWEELTEHREDRRLTWMVFDDRPGISTDRVTTHFDLAPTVLEMAGIGGLTRLGLGTSLLTSSDPGTGQELPDIDTGQVPRTLVSEGSVRESGFSIAYEDLTISVGNVGVKATKNGWKFDSGLFLFVLNEDGQVTDTIYSDDFARLIEELEGQYVIGISVHGKDSEYDDQYFYGRLSQNLAALRVQPLLADVHVPAEKLNF
jgi:phosphoglycerol transferase